MAVLLALTKVIPNWDIFARTQSLNWTSTTTMCQSWQGVQCQGPYVTGLNFSGPDPGEPKRPPILEGVDNVTVHGSMPIALQGALLSLTDYQGRLCRFYHIWLGCSYQWPQSQRA